MGKSLVCADMVLISVLAVFFFASCATYRRDEVYKDDVDELDALFNAEIRRVNTHNSDAFAASAHDGIVAFLILSPFAIEGKEAFRQVVQEYFDTHEQATFTAVNPQFRVAGTTAIAWGHYTLTDKLKDGPLEAFHGRYTLTYTKIEGRWVLVAMHFSPF